MAVIFHCLPVLHQLICDGSFRLTTCYKDEIVPRFQLQVQLMQASFSVLRHFALSSLISFLFGNIPFNSAAAAENSVSAAEVSKAAPSFTLKNVDGKSVSLNDFRNQFVVLEWFDDKCPFDKKHYNSGNMQSLQKEFGKKGVVWLVINSAGPGKPGYHADDEYKQIMKSWKFETPYFLLDPDGTVGHLYEAKTTPDMYIVGKNGILLYSGAIDDQPDTDIESIKFAKNYVREALLQAMAGKPITNRSTKPYG
jgi:glutathione peroxidase-family protein